ncbi:MAG: GNAT family N-acetyltransferase [Acidimicrobiia bacterium]
MAIAPEIRDEPEHHRFVADTGGEPAELVYRRRPGRLVLVHTGVPPELEGRGIGGRLVATAIDRARDEGLTVVPWCPYARWWLRHHPEVAASVTIDWTPPPEAP